MITNAANEAASAITGPMVNNQTLTNPTRSMTSTARAPVRPSFPCRARQAAYTTQGTIASSRKIQEKIEARPAPSISRIMPAMLTRPVSAPKAVRRFLSISLLLLRGSAAAES